LLVEANIELADCDAIAYGHGPGSFTGLRIAAAMAQGLALGANLPVIGISSLRVLAQTGLDELEVEHRIDYKYILVASDARIQEVYWGCYKAVATELAAPVIDDQLSAPELVSLPQNVPASNCYGVGNAWYIYKDALEYLSMQLAKIIAVEYPSAAALVKLAKEAFLQGKLLRPEEAVPVYLRDRVTHSK